MSRPGAPKAQLALVVEPPLRFFVYSTDGRLLDVINVDECSGGWHEASLWAYLAAHRDRERQNEGVAPGRISGGGDGGGPGAGPQAVGDRGQSEPSANPARSS